METQLARIVVPTDLPKMETLSIDDIVEILPVADDIAKWFGDVKELALKLLLSGEKIPGYKVVEGKSNRTISDVDKAAHLLKNAGYNESILYVRKFETLTNLEKLVGKAKLASLIGDLIIKPEGKPTLAPDSDKRPAMQVVTASDDFSDGLEDL